ncbi:hypothetical protein TYRP_003287 [Tyrophagus putrescentiae]|nr:hypothetical protein TYRP_003287 [Tyrophagus putrescentiae]
MIDIGPMIMQYELSEHVNVNWNVRKHKSTHYRAPECSVSSHHIGTNLVNNEFFFVPLFQQ